MSDSVNFNILLKQKTRSIYKEIFRKSIHLCSALIPTLLDVAYYPIIILLIMAVVFYSISEIFRLKGINFPIISKITEVAARTRDANKFVLGPVTLVIGILIAAIFLPPEAARIGIYALSFGDGTASLVGKLIGRVTIPFSGGKTVAGSLACFIAVYISCFCVCKNVLISFFVALSAMIIEVLPLKDFDNVIIPFVVGGIFLIVQKVLIM